MKVLLLLLSITIALFSLAVTFTDSLLTTISTYIHLNNATRTFEGLPVFLPSALYGARKSANMTMPRTIRKAFLAVEQSEGAGARVRRSIGTPQLRNFSPFLMLDHFTIIPGAGFPDHPHRVSKLEFSSSIAQLA